MTSLAHRILNDSRMIALTVPEERDEIKSVGLSPAQERVTLRRTFNMVFGDVVLKFWRVIGPANHTNYESDLSLEGLRDWGIIQ